NVAAISGKYSVIGRQLDLIPRTGAKSVYRLYSCLECGRDSAELPVGSHDDEIAIEEPINSQPAIGRCDKRFTRHARVRPVDPPVVRAGVPLVDRRVELHAGVGAAPGGEGDLVPEVP